MKQDLLVKILVRMLKCTVYAGKLEHRFASWKKLYFSKGGKVALIKSTLSNLPMYFMSPFPLPMGVANRIEKLYRDFLWGGLGNEFKYYLVSWSKVCMEILRED